MVVELDGLYRSFNCLTLKGKFNLSYKHMIPLMSGQLNESERPISNYSNGLDLDLNRQSSGLEKSSDNTALWLDQTKI